MVHELVQDLAFGGAYAAPAAPPALTPAVVTTAGSAAALPSLPVGLGSQLEPGAARRAAHGPVRAALELPRLTVTRMAEELGIPRATLEAYRLGTRRMPAELRARLASYLATHAEMLTHVVRTLEGTVSRELEP